MPDIFFYEAFLEEEEALRRLLPPGTDAGYTPHTIQESPSILPPARLISIRTQSIIPGAWESELEGILTRSTGFDHVRRYYETAGRVVPAGYLPLYCSRSVAEQAMLMGMALLRKLPVQVHNFRSFHRDGLTGRECLGRTLLVVGVGNIGSEVCRIGKALGMKVLAHDIVRKHDDITYVDIEEGMAQADMIICAMNLTGDNRGYFDYELLHKARPGIVFVNVARGELSPVRGLLRLMDEGRLGGVGLDVYENESGLAVALRNGNSIDDREMRACLELSTRKNVILTPHNAFNTEEALERKAGQSAEQVANFLANKRFIWEVPNT